MARETERRRAVVIIVSKCLILAPRNRPVRHGRDAGLAVRDNGHARAPGNLVFPDILCHNPGLSPTG
jgi:hypothetical protein